MNLTPEGSSMTERKSLLSTSISYISNIRILLVYFMYVSIPTNSLENPKNEDHEAAANSVEVSVPAFEETDYSCDSGCNNLSKQLTGSKRLFISLSGQCSTTLDSDLDIDGNDDASREEDVQDSLSRCKVVSSQTDKLGGPIRDMIYPCFLWAKKRRNHKKINAGQDVLNTYHESFLYGEVPLTTKIRAALRGGIWSSSLMWLESIAALFSVFLYVRSTYTFGMYRWITIGQTVCCFFFLVDYVVKLCSAPVALYYVFSRTGIVDFISVLPICFIWGSWKNYGNVLQIFLMLRILRVMPVLSWILLPGNAVSQEIFLLLTYTFGVVFIGAGILQWVEVKATQQSVKQENNCGAHGCWNYYEAFYFMIVTISTVGYGDITPKSNWGRFIVLCTILIALLLIPVEVNKILELASRRPYGGRYAVEKVVASRFIIISGNLTYRVVQDFLYEFYHPCHDKDMPAFPLRVVILAPFKPSFEMKSLLTRYKGKVDFIEGEPLKECDLERVGARNASAFFLLADKRAKDADAEDAAQIMRTLWVHRYCGSKVRIIVEMLKPENQDSPIWDDLESGIEIVCPEAICFQLLARSCQIKGLTTFIINLFKCGLRLNRPPPGHWMQQYCHGLQQQIYPIILPSCFCENKLLFDEAAEIVYLKFNIILFGLDVLLEGESSRQVAIYPKQRVIQHTDVGLVIAKDLNAAEKVTKFGMGSCRTSWCWKLVRGSWVYKRCGRQINFSRADDDFFMKQVINKRGIMGNSAQLRKHSVFYSDYSGLEESGMEMQKIGASAFGLMKSGHRVDLQSQLREIVCASSAHYSRTAVSVRDTSHSFPVYTRKDSAENKRIFSLEEAVDMAMSWPPLQKQERPDRAVLERRANLIQKNLEERTLPVVNLQAPHVLVCIQGAWPVNLFYFISSLRTVNLPNPPVVILHPKEPHACDWGCTGMFSEVYFVKGSPIFELDLVRAGVLQAEKVVILTQRARDEQTHGADDDYRGLSPSSVTVLDIDNVLITATVERLVHPIRDRVIVELHQEVEIHYLRPKFRIDCQRFDPVLYDRNHADTYMFTPAYIEGKGFCSAALMFLLYDSFFNRKTISIVEQLLSGGNAIETEIGEGNFGQRLGQIAVPKFYVGQPFLKLFIGLLEEEYKITLGLYRPVGTCNSIVSYVYTNPPPEELLQSGDLLYVLH
eukprot:c28369_g1_i3 orf=497-4030(-)